jgi:hypothetical protein
VTTLFSDALGDRQFISQYSIEPVGLVIHKGGVPADADANTVMVKMDSLDGQTILFDRQADHTATGSYETLLSSEETSQPGIWRVTFTYALDGAPQTFVGLLEVGTSSPAYDALDVGFKAIIESAWIRFADLFDSPNGGPHLQVYFQARFNRGRMAQLLQIAVNRLNTVSQPHMYFTLDPTQGAFPYQQWGGLLDELLYIECLKHLIRSYTEQPQAEGVGIARLDRRDYMDRWMRVLEMEERDATSMLEVFKIANMGLSRPRVLVGGGVYGEWATRYPFISAARPRYWARFYT